MDPEAIKTIGAGAGGSIMGAVLTFLGFKQRLSRIEVELDNKVNGSTCEARYEGLVKLLETQTDLAEETRNDVKKLLTK